MDQARYGDVIVIDALEYNNWDRALFEETREAGITCVHVTCASWEGTLPALENVGAWYPIFKEHEDLILHVERPSDVLRAKAEGKTGVILGFQNGSPLENNLSLVEAFHRLGVRIIQLTYNNQNAIGGGCYEANDPGLSRFGREVVREMNRAGILIDLSHSGEQTCLNAIAASLKPVAITHANPASFHPAHRNKSDRVLQALAESGGVLGFVLYPHLIGGPGVPLETFCDMVSSTADRIGIDHVGFGSDLTLGWPEEHVRWLRMGRWTHTETLGPATPDHPGWPDWPEWFQSPGGFRNLFDGLRRKGFSDQELSKVMGGNWLRLFEETFESG